MMDFLSIVSWIFMSFLSKNRQEKTQTKLWDRYEYEREMPLYLSGLCFENDSWYFRIDSRQTKNGRLAEIDIFDELSLWIIGVRRLFHKEKWASQVELIAPAISYAIIT